MRRQSVQPKIQNIYKVNGFFSFTESMGKNIGKNINKILSSKYDQKLIYHAEQSAADEHKTSKSKRNW